MLSDALFDGECAIRGAMTLNFNNLFADAEWWPLLHETIRQMAMLRMCLDHPKFDWDRHTPGTLDNVPARVAKWDQYRALAGGDVNEYFHLTPGLSTKRKGSAKAQLAKKQMFEAVTETEIACRWYICSPAWTDFYRGAARCHDKPMRMLGLVRMSLADLPRTSAFAAAQAGDMGRYYGLTADIEPVGLPAICGCRERSEVHVDVDKLGFLHVRASRR